MKASYKKLWKLLIDMDMKKSDLAEQANISVATITKLSKCENVNVDILVRICTALKCELWDIMELLPEYKNESEEPQAEINPKGGADIGKSNS
jgi:DNA-binding Xre family transcriptional regulator